MPHLSEDTVCAATGKPLNRAAREATAAPGSTPVIEIEEAPLSRRSGPRSLRIALQDERQDQGPMSEDLMGRTIDGKYEVVGVLGAGGMGKVYEAEHVALGRRVALKVLHANFMRRDDALARFHREARAAGSIGHPNICEVYDVGYLPDFSPYMVMELLHGTTLAERLEKERSLPVNEVFEIVTQVLSALVAAHTKGIIHRDIKPENVFLAVRVGCPPVVKLLDFGIVKPKHDDLELTHAGTIMGTPFYMAPELIRGAAFDHRIDLYACGVMLFEMLTGVLPFEAQHYHKLAQMILRAEPPDVTELRPELSVSWIPVIDKALAKKPQERYRSAEDFLMGLEDLRAGLALRRSVMVSSPAIELEEEPPPSVDIPVVHSVRGGDLILEERAPDTMDEPVARAPAPEPSLLLSSEWQPPALPEEPPESEAASEQPATPMLEQWDESGGYDQTRPAGGAWAPPRPSPPDEVTLTQPAFEAAQAKQAKERVQVVSPGQPLPSTTKR
jgi:serine/threonine-protein kinase